MPKIITFTACKFLDFGDDPIAKKQKLFYDSKGPTVKVCWNYKGIRKQYCMFKGELCGKPISCLEEDLKRCDSYEDYNHEVTL